MMRKKRLVIYKEAGDKQSKKEKKTEQNDEKEEGCNVFIGKCRRARMRELKELDGLESLCKLWLELALFIDSNLIKAPPIAP